VTLHFQQSKSGELFNNFVSGAIGGAIGTALNTPCTYRNRLAAADGNGWLMLVTFPGGFLQSTSSSLGFKCKELVNGA
jgi:hypothetical protein